MNFTPVKNDFLFKKNDASDYRIGDLTERATLNNSTFVLAGYPDDEGIKLNGGRPGASLGPDKIRRRLTQLTPCSEEFLPYYDLGNISLNTTLSERHEVIKEVAKTHLANNKKYISLGGGHDFGFPDGAAFLETFADQSPLVINFDAHLDVRPLTNGLSSGTPFFRLLSEYKDFDFYEIGIQEECNSITHVEWCKKMGGKILTYNDLYLSTLSPFSKFREFIKKEIDKKRPTFISVDIDVFSSSFAMGCSQSWPMGLAANDFNQIFNYLLKELDVKSLGVYEVSPPLDYDDRTSKLAAQIIYRFLKNG